MLDGDLDTAGGCPATPAARRSPSRCREEAEIARSAWSTATPRRTAAGAATVDWYPRNRRILEVEWVFDDGTTVPQDLRAEPVLQTIAVDKVRTSTISLRILEVSPPGAGALSKNVTAISDVLLRGAP